MFSRGPFKKMVDEDLLFECEPDVKATSRLIPAGKIGKMQFQCGKCMIPAASQFAAQFIQIASVQAAREKLGKDPLRDGAGTIVRLHLDITQPLYDRLGRNDPADAQSRRECFRGAAKVQRTATLVERFEGQGHFRVIAEFVVRTVLNDRQSVFRAQRHQRSAALGGHGLVGIV